MFAIESTNVSALGFQIGRQHVDAENHDESKVWQLASSRRYCDLIGNKKMYSSLLNRWHHLPKEEIELLLESDSNKGLDTFEIKHRQQQFGPNLLTLKKGKHPGILFLQQFHQPLVYILLAAAIVTFLLHEWVDSGVIFGVILVNAVVGFVQEFRALKAIEALALSMEGSATVVRAGKKLRIPSSELVPGDLVLLQSGDKVPADLRLLKTRELQIDESALTGESVPVQKQPEILPQETVLADQLNMAYSSTLVTYGTAAGLVVATGDNTEIGKINALISSADTLATPLTRKITEFSGTLALAHFNTGQLNYHGRCFSW